MLFFATQLLAVDSAVAAYLLSAYWNQWKQHHIGTVMDGM